MSASSVYRDAEIEQTDGGAVRTRVKILSYPTVSMKRHSVSVSVVEQTKEDGTLTTLNDRGEKVGDGSLALKEGTGRYEGQTRRSSN